ncbi:MAG: hypothetical protein U5L04_02210 [Trueperaceae bacterium]|nr:hypothetical protein [Trueperaceae bacterium]
MNEVMSQPESVDNSASETRHDAASEARVAELLLRYERGEFPPHVRRRLAEIFANDPPNAWKLLETACDYLNIRGDAVDDLAADEVTTDHRDEPLTD